MIWSHVASLGLDKSVTQAFTAAGQSATACKQLKAAGRDFYVRPSVKRKNIIKVYRQRKARGFFIF